MTVRRWATAIACIVALATGAFAQVPQLISYQGRVVVGTTNFNGTGQFKFALVNANGSQTYWSNNGSSTAGSEPSAAVSLTVTKGLYSVLLGDTSIAGMAAIPPNIFSNADVRLRIWFNDGMRGFQQLSPDQRLAAPIADGAVTTAKLADGSVTIQKLQSGDAFRVGEDGVVYAENFVPLSSGEASTGARVAATFSPTYAAQDIEITGVKPEVVSGITAILGLSLRQPIAETILTPTSRQITLPKTVPGQVVLVRRATSGPSEFQSWFGDNSNDARDVTIRFRDSQSTPLFTVQLLQAKPVDYKFSDFPPRAEGDPPPLPLTEYLTLRYSRIAIPSP